MVIQNRNRVAFFFLFPTLLGLVLFKIYPIIDSLFRSFYAFSFQQQREIFVFFDQYAEVLGSPEFWISLRVTLVFNLATVPLQVVMALALALLLNRRRPGINVIRSLIMFPVGISLPVATVMWGIILNPHLGLANSLIRMVGLYPQPFLTSSSQALPSIIWIATWKGVPYWVIFFLAGLKGIPDTYYECATIDGARAWTVFRKITLPLLRRTMLFVVAANTIANFLLFVPPYMLTRGGPRMSTNVLMYEVFKQGFVYVNMNRSLAMMNLLLVLLFVVIFFQFRLLRASHEY